MVCVFDDTFAKLKTCHIESFLNHLNQQHPRIKFTTELPENNSIPFLDTKVKVEEDGSITFGIYRKKTHTDQYLDFNSHHHIKQKTGIIHTFRNRIDTIITKEDDKHTELKHVKGALKACGHPEWSLHRRPRRTEIAEKKEDNSIGLVTLPYVSKTSEKIAKAFKKHNIRTAHKPIQTLSSVLFTRKKDKIHDYDKAGVVYYHKCKECDDDYVGETGRCWRERLHDHRLISHKDAKTAHTFTHQTEEQVHNLPMIGEVRRSKRISNKEKTNYFELATGGTLHTTEGSTAVAQHVTKVHDKDNIESKILTTESSWYRRGIKEALAILKHQPKLNEDHGRHPISQIYTIIPEYNIRRAKNVCAGADYPIKMSEI